MFCKIRKGKWGYSIYACDRKRVNGKVVSNDIKIDSYAWHSLYEDDEEINGLIDDIPVIVKKSILARCIKNKEVNLEISSVVEKLIKVKKEYYPTYKAVMLKIENDIKKEKEDKLLEYENFKNKYRSLHDKELTEKYQEGYERGLFEGMATRSNNSFNRGSGKKLEMDDSEKKLLKEAFKLLSFKHHPDRNGSTEKMAAINNLKDKILK